MKSLIKLKINHLLWLKGCVNYCREFIELKIFIAMRRNQARLYLIQMKTNLIIKLNEAAITTVNNKLYQVVQTTTVSVQDT